MMSTIIRTIVMIMNNKTTADGTTLAMISVVFDIHGPGDYISGLYIHSTIIMIIQETGTRKLK